MFLIKIYIKESYINYYHTIIQMCGQYCILAPFTDIMTPRTSSACKESVKNIGRENITLHFGGG